MPVIRHGPSWNLRAPCQASAYCGVGELILVELGELNPPVLGASPSRIVVGDGVAFPIPLGNEARAINSLANQAIPNCIGACLRQLQIVALVTG